MPWFYFVIGLIIKMCLRLFTRWQVTGRENSPSRGPLLIVANHVELADIPLLGVSLGRRVIFMAKEELFRSRLIGYFIGSFGTFPVHRGQLDRKALRQAVRVLADGQALVIFPEGMRNYGGQLRHAFPGSALIALRSGAPILPVAITGTERLKGVAWLLHRPQITVNIGSPFHLPPVNGKLSKIELTKLTNYIMRHISDLLPVEHRGSYAEQGELVGTED